MKKITLLLLLFISFSYAQEKDAFNNVLFNGIKKIEIQSARQKPIIIEQLDKILAETNDATLIKEVEAYKKEIDLMAFANEVNVDISKIDLKSKKDFRVKSDKFKEAIFITPKQSYNDFYPYIVINEGSMFMRLVNNYNGNNWLFMDTAIVLIENEKYSYSLGKTKREVVKGARVSERSDIIVDENTMDILRKIAATSGEVEIRLTGDRYSDKKFRKSDILKIQKTLELYDELSQTVK